MTVIIEYALRLDAARTHRIRVDVDRAPGSGLDGKKPLPVLPTWTELSCNRCPNCPLPASTKHCPAAVDLVQVIAPFREILSTERADVTVTTREREFKKSTDTQTALGSLVGLVMGSSGCPLLGELRPLARHHLPFSTTEETLYRTATAYLLRQYFVLEDGGRPDFGLLKLQKLYEELATLNTAFTARVREAARYDASLNAVVILFSMSVLVAASVEDRLERLRDVFKVPGSGSA
jgi:hypothetical protein